MRDQADKLRKLVRETVKDHPALEPGVPLVVVSGGATGVGTSTVAIQLARELARLGKRIVLADANLQQPEMTNRLTVDAEISLVDILSGERSAVEVLCPLGESIQFLPGSWATDSPPEMGREAVKRMLTELRSLGAHADMVIVDAGHGMSPWIQQLWRVAQQVLLVSTLESDAMKQSYATVKLAPWGDVDSKVRLVVNKSEAKPLVQQASERFAATCRRFLGASICQPAAVVTEATYEDLMSRRSDASSEDIVFDQSISLLSAEVLSSCLVLSTHRQLQASSSAKKSLKTSNITQTEPQV